MTNSEKIKILEALKAYIENQYYNEQHIRYTSYYEYMQSTNRIQMELDRYKVNPVK